jgi:prepilin-type N-terminal cleavage/methylation domain-containing protein
MQNETGKQDAGYTPGARQIFLPASPLAASSPCAPGSAGAVSRTSPEPRAVSGQVPIHKFSAASYSLSPAPRRGFTLIEMLMVIILVGVLAGLLLFAIGRGMLSSKNARVVTEINQLDMAFESYKAERGAYPPTLGVFVGESEPQKQARIMRHVTKAFPRYVGNYQQFKDDVALATQYNLANPIPDFPINLSVRSSYTVANANGLNIDNLDPAESIVFWLGGLPDPSAETKLAGFHLDPASPFVVAVARTTGNDTAGNPIQTLPPSVQGQRSARVFPFDPRRLVDYDQDGWWEYLPPGGSSESNTPPFVYFDFNSYQLGPAYPYPSAAGPAPAGQGTNESLWGNCHPYAADSPIANSQTFSILVAPIKFMNSQKFQIISAGLDNRFDERMSSIMNPPNPWWFKAEYFPSGQNYDDYDRDNLTNFAKGPIGDEVRQ